MHPLLVPSVLFIAGWYFLFRNIRYLKDQAELESYLATSPAGKGWLAKYGKDKTVELSKRYFLPIGIFVATIMICISSWSLFRILPFYV